MRIGYVVAFAAFACALAAGCTSVLGDFGTSSGGSDASTANEGGTDGAHPEDASTESTAHEAGTDAHADGAPDATSDSALQDSGSDVAGDSTESEGSIGDGGNEAEASVCSGAGTGTSCGPNQACNAGACVTVGAPQLVAPLSTALVTSQSPALRWVLAAGTTGAEIEICKDRACGTVLQTVTVTGSQGSPSSGLSRGVYFWRAHGMVGATAGTTTSPVWEMRVGQRSANVNTSWGTIVDVNGDGIADLAIGASSAGGSAGAAYVYLGKGPSGIASPGTALTPVGGNFGLAISSAGDVNGDGFGDVIVGADADMTAYVYLGGAGGISTSPVATLQGTDSYFGWSVASAGDVDGDGYGDVVVGAFGANSNAGAVYVYRGGPGGTATTPAYTLHGFAGAELGTAVAWAGDVNGDGYGDVLVGASGVSSYTGAAYVYLGGASGLGATPITIAAPAAGDSFGYSAWSADDVNGDGYADIVVGANYSTGAAYVFNGGTSGTALSPSTSLTSPGGANSFFGCSVSTAGDVNGDGYADVVVGAFETVVSGANVGSAYVYLGAAAGLSTSVATTLTNPNPPAGGGGFFGFAVAGAGDINGDGLADVAVGADENAGGVGDAYVYYGTGSGVATSPSITLPGPVTGGAFGKGLY